MKKLLSLVLALAMLLGCVVFAEGVDYTGTWMLTGAEADGIQMGPSMLAMVGLDMKMTLNADGSMTMATMGLEEAGTWAATATGIAINDGVDTLEVVYQNEILVMEDEGATMMFTREGAAPAIPEATGPVAQANVDPEAFEGQWLLTKVSLMGMDMPADQMGMYMAFVLADGAGLVGDNDTEDGSIQTANVVYTVAETENGTALSVVPEGAENPEEEALVLFLSEEGYLFVSEEGVSMVFEKQVEEAAAE